MLQAEKVDPIEMEAARLRATYRDADTRALLEAAIRREFPGEIMLTSSFGAEAAVLLDLVAQVDPATPVIFLDTQRLFGETLRYQRKLTERLGLSDVRVIRPDAAELVRFDRDEMLFSTDPDRCCAIRKVAPLGDALTALSGAGYRAWITGRKQFHGGARKSLELFEASGGFIKINPLARWTADDIKRAFTERDLPRHPLVEDGFASIGCMPCTERTGADAGHRSGRWSGTGKTECGIHFIGARQTTPSATASQ